MGNYEAGLDDVLGYENAEADSTEHRGGYRWYVWLLAMLRHPDLTDAAKLVLVVLVAHADNETGECWPSRATIAEHVGIGRRSVTRIINKQLVPARVVKIVTRGTYGTVQRYRLLPEALDAVPPLSTKGDRPGRGGDRSGTDPPTDRAGGRVTAEAPGTTQEGTTQELRDSDLEKPSPGASVLPFKRTRPCRCDPPSMPKGSSICMKCGRVPLPSQEKEAA